jgi:hypothetical protein
MNAMKTDNSPRITPLVVMAVLLWAAACRGQGLEIDIPVPEPGKAAEGKDAAKRKPSPRAENGQAARRNARQQPNEAASTLAPVVELALPGSEGSVSGRPTLAPPNGRSPRTWAGAALDDDSERDPTWANPAGIPLRQKESADAASKPSKLQARDKQQAAKSPSAARTPKTRAEGSSADSSGQGSWLSRWFQSGRRPPGQEESPPLVARRHRTPPQDHRDAPSAPPSPWHDGQQGPVKE